MQQRLFRKTALERFSSPEQLDQLMRVTTGRGWLVLIGLAGLVAVAIVWGFTGRIAVTAGGQGILIRGGGIKTVESSVAGQITNLPVEAYDVVEQGHVVAYVQQPGTEKPITVDSPYRGRVIEVQVNEGNFIQVGTRLLTLEPVYEPLVAILYVSPVEGKHIRAGMDVRLSPSTARKEEYGYLLGEVTSVGEYPATYQGMLRVLGNDVLVKDLSAGGSTIEVHVSLRRDDSTTSGYAWSSPEGPPISIRGGTLTSGQIVLDEVRPVQLLLTGK